MATGLASIGGSVSVETKARARSSNSVVPGGAAWSVSTEAGNSQRPASRPLAGRCTTRKRSGSLLLSSAVARTMHTIRSSIRTAALLAFMGNRRACFAPRSTSTPPLALGSGAAPKSVVCFILPPRAGALTVFLRSSCASSVSSGSGAHSVHRSSISAGSSSPGRASPWAVSTARQSLERTSACARHVSRMGHAAQSGFAAVQSVLKR